MKTLFDKISLILLLSDFHGVRIRFKVRFKVWVRDRARVRVCVRVRIRVKIFVFQGFDCIYSYLLSACVKYNKKTIRT